MVKDKDKVFPEFQFHKVQLKDSLRGLPRPRSPFQFHKVQLKVFGATPVSPSTNLFQFHKVQLKVLFSPFHLLLTMRFQFHKVQLKVN